MSGRIHIKALFHAEDCRLWSEKLLERRSVTEVTLMSYKNFAARKLQYVGENGVLR
jgi:hypothetical protein